MKRDMAPATRSTYPARPGARSANRLTVSCLAANRLTARGVVRAVLVFVVMLLAVGCQTTPTPVEELVTEPRGREAMALAQRASESDESDPAKASRGAASAPGVLVLGSVHLAQADYGYTETSFEQVRESLSAYEPDMVVVEQLPPDWPVGKGRDYRPGFALAQYAERWDMDQNAASALLRRHRADPFSTGDRCKLARAYFLKRDLANAAYHWLSAQWAGMRCPKPNEEDDIEAWLDEHAESEYAKIGYRMADRHRVPEIVSYDYQGDDARWFIGPARFLRDLVPFSEVSESNREVDLHMEQHTEDLISMLHFANSPEWIGLQYWLYEERHLDVRRNDMGVRQVENYWLRNREMFRNLRHAVEAHQPERVLVVTGMGHKYFVDTLVFESDYRWVDPREYLPKP